MPPWKSISKSCSRFLLMQLAPIRSGMDTILLVYFALAFGYSIAAPN
jgi:hypothetical protein